MIEIPLWPASGSVLTMSVTKSARVPLVMYVFAAVDDVFVADQPGLWFEAQRRPSPRRAP